MEQVRDVFLCECHLFIINQFSQITDHTLHCQVDVFILNEYIDEVDNIGVANRLEDLDFPDRSEVDSTVLLCDISLHPQEVS